MKKTRLLTLLCVLALVASACGGGEGAAATSRDSSQTTGNATSDDGGGSAGTEDDGIGEGSAGGSTVGNLPPSVVEDFPIPIPAGWEFDILGDLGLTSTTGVELLYPVDAFDEVVAFYDNWTDSQSVDYVRVEAQGQVVYQSAATPIVSINVKPNHQEQDETYTYLLVATVDADG